MITICRIVVPVNDIEADSTFYRAVLGLEGERVSPGRHYFGCGETVLSCFDYKAEGGATVPARPTEPIYLSVLDVEACRERAVAAGAGLDLAPREALGGALGSVARRPWGELSFYASDPSGNMLCFIEADSVFRSGTLNF